MDKFYDTIAKDYDSLVEEDIKNDCFPYGAYREMGDIIANYIFDNKHLSKAKILDLGVGTAALYQKLMPRKFSLTGIDSSKRMLEIAALKFPNAKFYNSDILKGLPEELNSEKYDYIILNYVVMHFDDKTVIDLINQLVRHLSPFGKIFIGDIMFLDEKRREAFCNANPKTLSYGYFFHTYSEVVNKADDMLALSFMELNLYTGILIVEKYYERSLHFEESLIKYKSNTVKWKSSLEKKQRE